MVRFPDNVEHNDCILTIKDRDRCYPGEKCIARLVFVCPELIQKFLRLGSTFKLTEAAHVIGECVIIEIE